MSTGSSDAASSTRDRAGPGHHDARAAAAGRLRARRLGDQLTAGGADVAAAGLAHRHRDAVIGQDLREAVDAIV